MSESNKIVDDPPKEGTTPPKHPTSQQEREEHADPETKPNIESKDQKY